MGCGVRRSPLSVITRTTARPHRLRRWWDRRAIRPAFGTLAVVGTMATALIVFAGGRVGPIRGTVRLTSWLGIVAARGVNPGTHPLPGLELLVGILVLIGVWLLTVRSLRGATMSVRRVWVLAACWSLPLIVGPPLLSGDVLTYAAQGLLVVRHLDPYHVGPAALGRGPAVVAVDPRWRSAPSPYGPVATAVQWASAQIGGGAVGAVVVLKVVAAISAFAAGVFAADLAPRRLRASAVTLTVLNPVMLLQVVSAGHLEGLMVALLLAAFVAVRRHHPYLGLGLACIAAAVKAPALIAVAVIVVYLVVETPERRRVVAGIRSTLTAAGVLIVTGALVPDGWGWLHTALSTPGQGHTPAAPTSLVTTGLSPFLTLTHVMSYATLAEACRVIGLLSAAGIAVYLLVTCRRRDATVTAGGGLLAVSLLGPVLYPWYTLWGSACLAPSAERARRDWIVVLSAITATMAIPGLSNLTIGLVAAAVTLTALSWVGWGLRRSRRARGVGEPSPEGVPATGAAG